MVGRKTHNKTKNILQKYYFIGHADETGEERQAEHQHEEEEEEEHMVSNKNGRFLIWCKSVFANPIRFVDCIP